MSLFFLPLTGTTITKTGFSPGHKLINPHNMQTTIPLLTPYQAYTNSTPRVELIHPKPLLK